MAPARGQLRADPRRGAARSALAQRRDVAPARARRRTPTRRPPADRPEPATARSTDESTHLAGQAQRPGRDVPDPVIQQPTDAIIKVTSTAICGSDLHLYAVLGPFLHPGDILGHETMGIVEEVGSDIHDLHPGDRVVVPFNISCGHCWMCSRGLFAQCETTQNREYGKGASLFGYTDMYGAVPGGQAEYLRVPQAQFGPVKVPDGVPTSATSTCPTSCRPRGRRSSIADVPEGGTVAVFGLGPVGQLTARIALHAALAASSGSTGCPSGSPSPPPRRRGARPRRSTTCRRRSSR